MSECTIPEFYKGKCLFVTGVTGFMGKILVEKLLRSCPDIKKIYVLIRSKRQDSAIDRWKKVVELPLFDTLKELDATRLDKVIPVDGNIGEKRLGLSEDVELEIMNNVEVVFHGAAAVQFSEDLIFSTKNNLEGTYHVAEFAKSFKKIKCFVYISTAYSNCDKHDVVEEKIYGSSFNWRDFIELVNSEPKSLAILRDKVKGKHPSTYTLTKALAEDVMNHYSQYYPVVLTRPSIVLSTIDDPIPGWVDSLNGVSAMSIGCAAGVIRVFKGAPSSCLDYISADHAIKALIIAGWKFGRESKASGLEILSVNYGKDVQMTLGELFEEKHSLHKLYPTVNGVWYPFTILIKNSILFWTLFAILQIIPAYIFDMGLKITGRKPRLVDLTIRIAQAYSGPFEKFTHKQFAFPNENFKKLNTVLYESDKKDFQIDFKKYTSEEYLHANCSGICKYYLKEPSWELRVRHFQRLKIIHYTACSLLTIGGLYLIYNFMYSYIF